MAVIDFNLKNIGELKEGSLLIYDGKQFKPISKQELLKDLKKEVGLLKQTIQSQNIVIKNFEDKMVKFLKIIGGVKE